MCCVAISAFRNAQRRSLLPSKRYTAIFCYNSPSWRQPQQLRQRLIPLRRIQSSGESGRSASTTSGATVARSAAVQATASMTSCATSAGNVAVQATASTTSGATCAGNVAVQAYVSTTSGAPIAGIVVAQSSVSMTRNATAAQNARTYHALWKAAHNTATASVQPKRC